MEATSLHWIRELDVFFMDIKVREQKPSHPEPQSLIIELRHIWLGNLPSALARLFGFYLVGSLLSRSQYYTPGFTVRHKRYCIGQGLHQEHPNSGDLGFYTR
jgi:hypothetical protein